MNTLNIIIAICILATIFLSLAERRQKKLLRSIYPEALSAFSKEELKLYLPQRWTLALVFFIYIRLFGSCVYYGCGFHYEPNPRLRDAWTIWPSSLEVQIWVTVIFIYWILTIIIKLLDQSRIYDSNTKDHKASLALANHFKDTMIRVVYSVVEPAIGKDWWWVFKVDRLPDYVLRARLSGNIHGSIGVLGGMDATMTGSITGKVTPDIKEMTSILFLRNENNETIRVIVPSQEVMETMTAKAYMNLVRVFQKNTHTYAEIQKIMATYKEVLKAASADWLIDWFESNLHEHPVNRPKVKIYGVGLDDNTVLATAIETKKNKYVLIRTEAFDALGKLFQGFSKTRIEIDWKKI